ncbi:MAG: immune inhibitor A [Thermoleophilia bacterium]|nr:immune inhibitor A [Thermoleophilia bacterium]
MVLRFARRRSSQADNDTARHPGYGIALPVDAHPAPLMRTKPVAAWRNRIQTYDATFGLDATEAMTLHYDGKEYSIPSLPAVAVFEDNNSYYNTSIPLNSVNHPQTGTVIEVLGTAPAPDGGSYMGVRVSAPSLPE